MPATSEVASDVTGVRALVEKAPQMTKSQTEMLEMRADREYSDFQRSRPDLSLRSLYDLFQDEPELLVAAFQLNESERDEGQTARPCRIH